SAPHVRSISACRSSPCPSLRCVFLVSVAPPTSPLFPYTTLFRSYKLADHPQARFGAGDLDERVGELEPLPQAPRFRETAGAVVREVGRHFHADEPVAAGAGVIQRAQQRRRGPQILDGELLVQGQTRGDPRQKLGDRPRVLGIRRDRVAEDRRVGGESRDAIVPDEAREGSLAPHAATDVIEPCALAELAQLEQRIGYRRAHTVTLRRE